jgi:predicted secreted protein
MAAQQGKVFTHSDRRIRVRAGERFTIELKGIPGAGYEWTVVPNRVTRLISTQVEPAQAMGGESKFNFVLEALAKGSDTLKAVYKRRWEAQPHTTITFELEVA